MENNYFFAAGNIADLEQGIDFELNGDTNSRSGAKQIYHNTSYRRDNKSCSWVGGAKIYEDDNATSFKL